MIFKCTWPDNPERGDVYIEAAFADFTPDPVTGILTMLPSGATKPVSYSVDGMRVYLLDADGRTIDKPKLPTRGDR
jgi:hypothetical protein